MIEIATKSKSLDLLEDSKVTIKQKSSLFTILEKEDKQSHSYPFTLPLSPRNNSVLSNSLLEEKESAISVSCKKNGVRLFKADMRVTENTNENYEVALQLNQKVDLFNRKMDTLVEELGAFHITDSVPFVEFIATGYSEYPEPWGPFVSILQKFVVTGITYNIEINDIVDYATQIADIINADAANNNALVTVLDINKIKIERVNSSFPFYVYNVEQESVYNIFWFPLPINRNANRTLTVEHSNTIDALVDFRDVEYCFPYFTTVMEGQPTNFITINNFNTIGVAYTQEEYNITLPSLRITAIIEKILACAGWKLESDFLKELDIEKLFLLNVYGIALEGGSNWDTIQNIQFFYSDCLPNISFVEFINELKNLFCLKIDWNHTKKTLKIEPANLFLSNKLAKEYKCTPVFSQKMSETKEGYTLKYNIPAYEDYVETYVLSSKIIENGSVEVVSNFPFLATNNLFGEKVKLYLGGLAINKTLANNQKNSLKYLTDKFWLKDGECKSINFMDYTTRQAHHSTSNYSLIWEKLYNQFWKNYLELLDKSEVEREIIFTFSELQSLDLLKRIRLEYSNYYIKELEYTLTNNEQIRILAKVILIKTI